jgi:hypothetical protein
MTIENDFLPWAVGANSNVVPQATYAALAALATGFQSGAAPSPQCNKVWRQSSIMAAVLAQLIVQQTGQAAIDDGTTATLLANLTAAIQIGTAAKSMTAATYAMLQADRDLIANYAGTVTVTLLNPASYPGKCVTIKTINNQSVVSAGSNVVPLAGGAAGTAILTNTAGKWARLVSDGTNWQIMESN